MDPTGFSLCHPEQDSEALGHRQVMKIGELDKRIRIEVLIYSDEIFGPQDSFGTVLIQFWTVLNSFALLSTLKKPARSANVEIR